MDRPKTTVTTARPLRIATQLGLAVCLVTMCVSLLPADDAPPAAVSVAPGTIATPTLPPLDQLISDSATGVILPDEPLPAPLHMTANAANAWVTKGTHHLLLDGDTQITIGAYGFKANRAVVLLTPIRVKGREVRRMALYLDKVTELGGYGPISAEAPRLLITAVLDGPVKLTTPLLRRETTTNDALVTDALNRIARYYQALVLNTIDLPQGAPLHDTQVFIDRAERQRQVRGGVAEPVVVVPPDSGDQQPTPPVVATPPDQTPGEKTDESTGKTRELSGRVDFAADRIVGQNGKGKEEGTILLIGNIRVMYYDPQTKRSMSLIADKAVILLVPDADTNTNQPLAKQVRGIYLEDNVIATDGQYTVRGPRVFYDLARDKAIVLDGVFYTWDVRQQVPIYVRARTVRQESLKQWRARSATLSTSEFAEPHLALGARDLTITESQQPGQEGPIYNVKADDMTVKMGGLPVFWWPAMAGQAKDIPLRSVGMSYESRDGLVLRTDWDLFGLAGKQKPEGVDATLILDGYTGRGAAIGAEVDYDVPKAYGSLDSYLMLDFGEDEPGGRMEIDPDQQPRGRINWQHRHILPAGWEATFELGYASDPTFLEEFFQNEAYADKDYQTLAYFKRQEDDSAFSFLLNYDLMDYPSNMATLQTPGYTVEKYPEAAYYRVGTPLFNNTVTWYSENRGSVMRLNLPNKAPSDFAFNTAESVALFGIAAGTRFDTAMKVDGYSEDTVYRFDTRQELQMPLKAGPIDVVPYVTGRFTAYDADFTDFSDEDDNMRFWGAAGVRLHTAFHRSYDQVESRLFDLHRMRHIIEPNANIFHATTTIEQEDLPVYDYDVESIIDGTVTRLGLRNTLQTQRGGPGRWRNVDWFRLDTDLVLHSGENNFESPVPRMFDYRPEYSLGGDHFWAEAVWQLTDTFMAIGDYTYSLESNETEQWGVGIRIDHNPRLTSFVETRHIDPLRTLYIRYGVEYLLSPKYYVSISHAYDFDRQESRSFSVVVTRRLPRMLLMVGVDIDTVSDEHSIGISLAPEGLGGTARPTHNPFMRGHEFSP